MEGETTSDCGFDFSLRIRKHLVLLIASKKSFKIAGVRIAEQFPVRLLMLNDRGYDLIGLREVVIHMDVLKAFRHSTPSISFFLGELIYVI